VWKGKRKLAGGGAMNPRRDSNPGGKGGGGYGGWPAFSKSKNGRSEK